MGLVHGFHFPTCNTANNRLVSLSLWRIICQTGVTEVSQMLVIEYSSTPRYVCRSNITVVCDSWAKVAHLKF